MEGTRGARGARVRRSGKPRGRVNVGLTRTAAAEAAAAGAIGHGSLLWFGRIEVVKVTLVARSLFRCGNRFRTTLMTVCLS